MDRGDKTKIADKLGVTPAFITMLLQGKRRLSMDMVIGLEKNYGLDIKVLINASPEKLSKLLKHHLLSERG